MISNGEKLREAKSERRWHYLTIKNLSALLRGTTSKHHGNFYCLNCFHSFATENKLESHKRACENKDFYNVNMPSDDTKILAFNQYQKYDKAPFSIYTDLECIIEKIDGCKHNLENSLTKEQQVPYENSKICYIYKEKFENKYLKDRKYCKVRDHCHYTGEYRGAAHDIFNLKYSVPKKIPAVFNNGSNYDYHFIIKELAEEFKKQFTCLGENTKKYITFSVPLEKEVKRIDKNGEEITKNISYILQFIDSARFTASSLSNLVNNFSEGIHRIKCKYGHNDKKCETCETKNKYCDCFF